MAIYKFKKSTNKNQHLKRATYQIFHTWLDLLLQEKAQLLQRCDGAGSYSWQFRDWMEKRDLLLSISAFGLSPFCLFLVAKKKEKEKKERKAILKQPQSKLYLYTMRCLSSGNFLRMNRPGQTTINKAIFPLNKAHLFQPAGSTPRAHNLDWRR